MIFEGRFIVSLTMLAIFAAMVGYASTFPADARFLPWVVGIPGLLMCIAQLVLEWTSGTPEERDPAERRREIRAFAWFVAFILGILLFGFTYAGPVLVAAYLYFDWNERPATVLGAAAVLYFVLFGIFEWALELHLFEGFVSNWLAG